MTSLHIQAYTEFHQCLVKHFHWGRSVFETVLCKIGTHNTQFSFSLCVLKRHNIFSNIPKNVFYTNFYFYILFILYLFFAIFEIGCYGPGPTWLMPKSLPVANFKVFVIKRWMYKKFTHITLDKYFKLLKNAVLWPVKLQYLCKCVLVFLYRLLQFLQSTKIVL